MTDQPKWMPDDEQLRGDVFHAFSMEECGKADPMAVIRDTIRTAVEKALAEREVMHRRGVERWIGRIGSLNAHLAYWLPDETMIPEGRESVWRSGAALIEETNAELAAMEGKP